MTAIDRFFQLIAVTVPLACSISVHAGTNQDSIEKKVTGANARSIDEMIAVFPQTWKANFVLMEKSLSLQQASREFPRAIVFSPDATVMYAFNGSADQHGYDTVESIEYIPKEDRYDFRRYSFPNGGPMHVERNPAICANCHGQDPRPNWESYNIWPGAIGHTASLSTDEEAILRDFVSRGAKMDRYRQLDRQANLDRIVKAILRDPPAFQLDVLLGKQKVKLLVDQIRSAPDYNRFKFGIMAALTMCPNIESYFPGEAWATAESLKALHDDTAASFTDLPAEPYDILSHIHGDANTWAVARLRWIHEGRSIVWPRLGFSRLSPYLIDAVAVDTQQVFRLLNDVDPEFKIPYAFLLNVVGNEFTIEGYYKSNLGEQHLQYCADLKAKSLKRISGN